MNASIEISMYPLKSDYEAPILDFITRLNQYSGLSVRTNQMSTQVFGEYELLMDAVKKEIAGSFLADDTSVFVLKILNINLQT